MRTFKFKAWDLQHKILTRLSEAKFVKGEIRAEGFELIQFTGFVDKMGQEIYDGDILLMNNEKYVLEWSEINYAWQLNRLNGAPVPLSQDLMEQSVRICNKLEETSSS